MSTTADPSAPPVIGVRRVRRDPPDAARSQRLPTSSNAKAHGSLDHHPDLLIAVLVFKAVRHRLHLHGREHRLLAVDSTGEIAVS
jgi:hypothetical protein